MGEDLSNVGREFGEGKDGDGRGSAGKRRR